MDGSRTELQDVVHVSVVERDSPPSVPFHVTPITGTWSLVRSGLEVILLGRGSVAEPAVMRLSWPIVSLVTISHVVKLVKVRHQSVTPMGPCLSVGPVIALLPDPHVGSLAAENIFEPAPSVRSFLLLVSGPDNLSLALPVRLWWTTRCLETVGPVVIWVLQFSPVDRVKSGHVGSRLRATQTVSIYRTYRESNPRKASFRLLFDQFPILS